MPLVSEYTLIFFFCKSILVLLVGVFLSYLLVFIKYKKIFQIFYKNDYLNNLIKSSISTSIVISYIFFLIFYIYYFKFFNIELGFLVNGGIFLSPSINCKLLNLFNFEFCLDFFGLILLHLAYVAGILSLLALDTRVIYKNIKYLGYINIFTLTVFMFVFANNLLLLFLFYEFLLLPSILLVYFISPSRRAIQATLYFII